jgi:hypothetical protein
MGSSVAGTCRFAGGSPSVTALTAHVRARMPLAPRVHPGRGARGRRHGRQVATDAAISAGSGGVGPAAQAKAVPQVVQVPENTPWSALAAALS